MTEVRLIQTEKRFNRGAMLTFLLALFLILAFFASTARNEVDLGELTTALARVVDETMQPETVSLWLHNTKKMISN